MALHFQMLVVQNMLSSLYKYLIN